MLEGTYMSGHSKWATTKHRKAAQDAKRSALFSKLSRNITVAAKEGGDPNPDNNASLAAAIEKAKGYSLPKDKIKVAIDKAFGSGKDSANYETVVYEGYGPAGVAVLCEALTDNRNRTAADVRAAFSHAGGNLGTSGSVAFQFERKGQIMVPKEVETGDKKNPVKPNGAAADEEEFMLAVAEAGGDDYEDAEDEWIVYTSPTDLMAVKKALEAITECVKTGKGNLLELAIEAAKVRASLGEISDACEVVVGRYKAVIRSISGVYSSEVKSDPAFEHAKELVAKFAKKEGRQPRIMIAKLGQDGHDRGAKVVATGYADIGFDVDMGPLFQTPEEAAKQAVENDVHVVGVSSLAAGHLTLVPQIIAELKKLGREDIIVIVGGVIPAQDYDELYRDGAAAIFGPGTPIATAAIKIMEILLDEQK